MISENYHTEIRTTTASLKVQLLYVKLCKSQTNILFVFSTKKIFSYLP